MSRSILFLVAASAPAVLGFAMAPGAAPLSLSKPALSTTMMLPDPATTMDAANSLTTLLAKSSADKALDDFFSLLWPATTVLSAAWILKILVDNEFPEGGPRAVSFVAVFAIFSFIFIALAVPF